MAPGEEGDPFVGPPPEADRRQGRPGARWPAASLAAAAGLVLAVGAASRSVGAAYQRAGVRTVERVIRADAERIRDRDRIDDRQEEKEKEKEEEAAMDAAQGAAEGEEDNVSLGNVTNVSRDDHRLEGCYDAMADYKLLTDGYVFDFLVRAVFSTVEDGTVIVDSACNAFDFTIQNKFAKFTMNGLLNVPEATEAEDGMSVTSAVPLEPGVPFMIRVSKGIKWSKADQLPPLCIQVHPEPDSAEERKVVDRYMADADYSTSMKLACSYWKRSEGLYQMMPAGGLTFGPDQGRRLQATTTADAASTTTDDGDINGSSSGELPEGWSYEQKRGEICIRVDIPGLSHANLTSSSELAGNVEKAISEAIAIEGSWAMTQSTSDVELMNTPDGVTALVTATPFQYDDINEFYRRLEETHVSKVITARLQQIPGIKAACQSEPCNFTATAGPFLEAAQCSTSFLSEVPYEKSVPSLYCVGKTCADVCYPETTCGNVICGDAMKANNGSADTTCKGEDDCMDKCCVVMCSSWVCPKHTCDFRTEATEATPSEANETCCVMPEVECCRAGNAFCEACRECVNISEQCAQSPNDSACKPDEAPDCGMSVTSQFDTGTGKAVFSTAVIYGGSRAFSGGYGNASSGAEYRAWVWEIRTGETLMSFGTQTPVMVVAPSADGIHALTGEQSGTATAWNYVQGGPAFRTLLPDSSKSGPVVGIAGGFTYQTSYVTGGDFVEFWQWGPDRVGTFKAPNLLTEQQELQQRAETLKAVAVNMSDNPGLSAVGRKQLLEMASPEALSTTEQALKTGVLSLAKVTAVVQLPGNSNFASGDANGVIRYFNYRTLTVLQEIHGHAGKVTAFSAFATGTRLLSGGEDGKIILWNIATGDIMRTWTQPFGGAVRTLQQVRHGTAFLAGSDDGFIRRYELNGGEDFASAACRQAVGGGGAVYDIAANDGNPSQIITSSKDGVARVWKL